MNLGVFEALLLRTLQHRLPGDPALLSGPAWAGAATGVRPQVFVHAARFDDLGGTTAEGASIARLPWTAADGASGLAEDRPARVEIDLQVVAAQGWQAQLIAGKAAAPALRALETLSEASLGDPDDSHCSLRFTHHRAWLQACRSERREHDGVAVHSALLTFRLDGFLQMRLADAGGLRRDSAHAVLAPQLEVVFDPEGPDLQREHVLLRNPGATLIDLAGWSIEDTARRPHRYRFPPLALVAPGAELRLYSGRGQDDARSLYWGRRQAVWNNSGDTAILRDPDGVERARAAFVPPAKPRARRIRK